jgi:hypothetical protein
MAFVHGSDTKLFAGIYDISNMFNQVTLSTSRQVVSSDVFGNDDHTFVAGIGEGSVSLGGIWDDTATSGSDALLYTALSGDQVVVTVSPEGATTIGQRAWLGNVRQESYPWRAPNDDLVRLNSGRMGDGGLRGGVILKEFDAETSTGNLASVDNGASSANGAVGHLHVTAFSGTDMTVVIADSANDSDYANNIAFTQVTGITSERATSSGTVDQYARVEITGTFTSATFVVAFARNLFS